MHLPIVSDEAFRLNASQALCMLMDALRYLSNPDDKVARASLIINYKLQITNENKEGRMEKEGANAPETKWDDILNFPTGGCIARGICQPHRASSSNAAIRITGRTVQSV